MAAEPVTIFSHTADPAGVARLIQKLVPDAVVTGPAGDWSEIEITVPERGIFRRKSKLIFSHDADYYSGPDWSSQLLGMSNYFSAFSGAAGMPELFRLIRSFQFSLGVPAEDLDLDSDDPRLDLLYEVAGFLDAALFTPSSLRDSNGRILLDASGYSDPEAVFPQMPAQEEADFDIDDEDDEPSPPSPQAVARRALVLTAVAARATLELDHLQKAVDNAETHRERMVSWLETLGLQDEPEPQEWDVLLTPVGSLERQDHLNAMWRVEGLTVLAWALNLYSVPPYDETVFPPELYEAMGLFDTDRGQELLTDPRLRSEEELAEMQKQLLAFHWRMRDFFIRPQPMDFVHFSHDCWFGSFDISDFRTIDNDLAIGDAAISDADPDDVCTAGSIAMERHLAINWLMGYAEIYSETDTST